MGIFIFLFAVLGLMSFTTSCKRQTSQGRLLQAIFCTALLVCIQGLRHETIGIDSCNAYRPFFESVIGGIGNIFDIDDVLYGFEPGFVIFTKIIKTLFSNTQLYILICSSLSIIPIGYLIYKYADNIPLAFIIFSSFIIYHFGFSGIRQTIAIGITTIAFEFIIKKRLLWFVTIVLLATSIHSSAIIFLIAYPLYHRLRLTPKAMFLVAICFIAALFFIKPIVLELTGLIFGGERYMNKAMENAVPSYNLMILLAGLLLFTYLSEDKRLQPIRPILLMSVISQSLGLVSNSASRIAYYFIPYFAIALPITTSSMKSRPLIEFIIVSFFIFFFFFSCGNGYLEVIPYKFFWE